MLAFGLPGTGKTHALCALGHRLVEVGHSVLFVPAYRLVQELLAAKRDLDLPRQLRKLDNFDFLLLDDLGYLPQGAEESEVLFTLIAERYERRSLGITSNLVFSEWERIFANPMATAAAIDRVVHHSVILEFDVPSYRTNAAQQRGQAKEVNRPGRVAGQRCRPPLVHVQVRATDTRGSDLHDAIVGVLQLRVWHIFRGDTEWGLVNNCFHNKPLLGLQGSSIVGLL